jgi:phage shock protein A
MALKSAAEALIADSDECALGDAPDGAALAKLVLQAVARSEDEAQALRAALEEALARWAAYDERYGHHRERIAELRKLI